MMVMVMESESATVAVAWLKLHAYDARFRQTPNHITYLYMYSITYRHAYIRAACPSRTGETTRDQNTCAMRIIRMSILLRKTLRERRGTLLSVAPLSISMSMMSPL